jgi:hypothetical protein
MPVQEGAEDRQSGKRGKGSGMDAARCFEVALDHYRKGNELLNFPVAVLMEEQTLHAARATAHFSAGTLALALGHAQQGGGEQPPQ